MRPKTYKILVILIFSTIGNIFAQTCASYTFSPPTLPASCDYTYTASGWQDSSGNPTSAPNTVNSSTSVCILANNNDDMPKSGFKGTLYIAPGVTYTGEIKSFNGATAIIAGTMDLPTNPSIGNSDIYVYDTGSVTLPGTLNPSGNSNIYNDGVFNIGGDLQMGGNVLFVSFPSSYTTVTGDSGIASEYTNCGILEIKGELSTGGSSALTNYCTMYIHEDMTLNADYTNDGLLVIDGVLDFGTATFFNNDILILENIDLSNDDLVGNDLTSLLIIKNNATLTSGGTITGHLFFDVDDGGGFDSVCAGCIEDVDELVDVTIPVTTAGLLEACGANIKPNEVVVQSRLDFDGVDDYISTPAFIEGQANISIMAWVKSDTGNATNMTIAGEDTGCKIWLENGNKPSFTIKPAGDNEETIKATTTINLNEWHHIAATYTASDGKMFLYVDGVLVADTDLGPGAVIESPGLNNGNFEIGRTSKIAANRQYFKGDIDEVRVFQEVLTESQIQRMIHQEIKDNSGTVQGTVIGKNIEDTTTKATINWSSLLAYYPMNDIISYDRTTDFSNNARITKLNNMTTEQEQTAPMPYITQNAGNWTSESTWLHGNVWDIDNIAANNQYSIVQISHNVNVSHNIENIGLIIDAGNTLTSSGSISIYNKWYLELNGTIDLANDSQLIQSITSDLVTSSNGKILRRQEGQTSPYRYNYWASPVGATGSTSLTDNNSTANNTNNSNYSISLLKDGSTGASMTFTGGLTANNNISTAWLYTYISQLTYDNWQPINQTSPIKPGTGYTQKGTGTTNSEQQYIFEGKPNNGTIIIDAVDIGGPGSVTGVSQTQYLLGNPYPSALDVHQFLDDNAAVLSGKLNLWEHWGGDSHVLNEYEGGYATVNKLGSIKAYQFVGKNGGNNGSQGGQKYASRYLAVGQGFMAEIVKDGNVQFNNSQRAFIKEADADGSNSNGSVFFRSTKTIKKEKKGEQIKTIRLECNGISGSQIRRELLMGFSTFTSDAYDYGYDAENNDVNDDDLLLNFEDKNMGIQAYGDIHKDKKIKLDFRSSGEHTFEIKITQIENISDSQSIYLKDNLLDRYFDLTQKTPYTFSSTEGVFNDRFEIVFQKNKKLNGNSGQGNASNTNQQNNSNAIKTIHFNSKKGKLHANLNTTATRIDIISMSGQTLMTFTDVSQKELRNGLNIPRLKKGAYIAKVTTTHETIAKKIVAK